MSVVNDFLGDDATFIFYNRVNLLPSDIYEPFLRNPIYKREFVQITYAWDNLVLGNWRLFHKLLRLQSMQEQFEIYIGFSNKISTPKCKVSSGCISPIDKNDNMYLNRKLLNEQVNNILKYYL